MKFSEKLIELRKQKGLSQEELGYQINVSRQTVSKWEAEQSIPEVEKVKELSKLFNVSIEYLLNDELENPKQKIKKFNKKKIILKILFIILAIYLIISLFKFIILLRCAIKASKIADYNNYTITSNVMINDNNVIKFSDTATYSNGTKIINQYEEGITDNTTYINLKEGKAYKLTYDKETNTYYYNNLLDDEIIPEEVLGPTTIRDLTRSHIDDTVLGIITDSLNPNVKVSLEDGMINIERKQKDLNTTVVVNRETGIVDKVLIHNKSDYENYTYNTYYGYIFDNNDCPGLTDEPDLESINYIVE